MAMACVSRIIHPSLSRQRGWHCWVSCRFRAASLRGPCFDGHLRYKPARPAV